MMTSTRQSLRRPAETKAVHSLTMVKLPSLEKADLDARFVDISHDGLGIVTERPLDRGLVWFKDPVAEHRGGVVVWSKKLDEHSYRAGIKFVLFPSQEAAAQAAPDRTGMPQALRDPQVITSILVDEISDFVNRDGK